MILSRLHILAFVFLWPQLANSQSQDYVIKDFHENPADLSAVSANIKDLNGRTAALLRFAVRDTLFDVDANMGILKQEKRIGEIWVFVPQDTRRITVRHPHLGIMRDYVLPVPIVSKTTYDVEIVITNELYLQSLGLSRQDKVVQESKTVEVPVLRDPTDDMFVPSQSINEKKPKEKSKPSAKTQLGGGYNILGIKGPMASIGFEVNKLFIGADYVMGTEKIEDVGIYYTERNAGTTMREAYNYTANRIAIRIGFNAAPESLFQVIPLVGVSINMIKGTELASQQGYQSQFSETYPVSVFGALRFQLAFGKNVRLHVTPQYDFTVSSDDVYTVLKESDDKMKAWCQGFGVNAGLLLRF